MHKITTYTITDIIVNTHSVYFLLHGESEGYEHVLLNLSAHYGHGEVTREQETWLHHWLLLIAFTAKTGFLIYFKTCFQHTLFCALNHNNVCIVPAQWQVWNCVSWVTYSSLKQNCALVGKSDISVYYWTCIWHICAKSFEVNVW